MYYLIEIRYEDRVRFLNWDGCGCRSTSRGKARAFHDLEEAVEVLRNISPAFRGADLRVLSVGKPTDGSRAWRRITQFKYYTEEHTSVRGNRLSWRAVPVTTLTLECGHEKVVRGGKVPRHRTVCKECEADL